MTPAAASVASDPHAEPLWIPARRLLRSGVPGDRLPWLLDADSLTRRIQSVCDDDFRVEVLRQRRERPLRNESRALGLRPETMVLVRQVHLYCGAAPWVYARTVVPDATLAGRWRRLKHLRARSLGALLFAEPSVRRGELEVTCLTPRDRLFGLVAARLPRPPRAIWGRRSLFYLGDRPLLVSEFFLPELGAFPS